MRTILAMVFVLVCAPSRADEPARPSVSSLVRQLTHKNGEKRLHAAAALGDLGPKAKSALPALTKALTDPHRMVRFYAAQAIGKIETKISVELWTQLNDVVIRDESWIVARQAAITIEGLNPKGDQAVSILLRRQGWRRHSPLPGVPPLPVATLQGKSTKELLKILGDKDHNKVVRVMLILNHDNRIKTRRLIRDMVSMVLFHKAKRVRRFAGRIAVTHGGADAATAVAIANDVSERKSRDTIMKVAEDKLEAGEYTLWLLATVANNYPRRIRNAASRALRLLNERTLQKQRNFVESLERSNRVPKNTAAKRNRFDDAKYTEDFRTRLNSQRRKGLFPQYGRKPMLIQLLWVLTRHRRMARPFSKDVATFLLSERNEDVIRSVTMTLVALDPLWKDVSSTYRTLLRSKNSWTRERAVKSLSRLPSLHKAAAAELTRALNREKKSANKLLLLKTLKKMSAHDAASLTAYLKLVEKDADRVVRAAAAETISHFKRKAGRLVKPLFAALEREKNPSVKLQIVIALQSCMKKDSEAQPLLRKLTIEYSRTIAFDALRSVIRRQRELTKDTQQLNIRAVLGKGFKP